VRQLGNWNVDTDFISKRFNKSILRTISIHILRHRKAEKVNNSAVSLQFSHHEILHLTAAASCSSFIHCSHPREKTFFHFSLRFPPWHAVLLRPFTCRWRVTRQQINNNANVSLIHCKRSPTPFVNPCSQSPVRTRNSFHFNRKKREGRRRPRKISSPPLVRFLSVGECYCIAIIEL
jgi:hypothetical protein